MQDFDISMVRVSLIFHSFLLKIGASITHVHCPDRPKLCTDFSFTRAFLFSE